MDERNGEETVTESQYNIQDLPGEILKCIFIQLRPHCDFATVERVCHRWKSLIEEVRRLRHRKFMTMFGTNDFMWTDLRRNGKKGSATLSPRMMYSICYNEHTRALYLFGGRTESTRPGNACFNDLWKFSLKERKWTRPLLSGDFPPPKFNATLSSHGSRLYLYGGCTLTMSNPFTMATEENISKDLHIFDVETCRWKQHNVLPHESPTPVHRHRSCVITGQDSDDACLFVYGGSTKTRTGQSCLDKIWCFEFESMKWHSADIIGDVPPARHSHTQLSFQSETSYSSQVLVTGGVDSTGVLIYHDAYLLHRSGYAEWTSMYLRIQPGPDNFIPSPVVFVSPAVKVGKYLVFVSPATNDKLPEAYNGNITTLYHDEDVSQHTNGNATPTPHLPTVQRKPLCIHTIELSFGDKCTAQWLSSCTTSGHYIPNTLGPNRPSYYTVSMTDDALIIHGDSLHDQRHSNNKNVQTPLYFISPNIS